MFAVKLNKSERFSPTWSCGSLYSDPQLQVGENSNEIVWWVKVSHALRTPTPSSMDKTLRQGYCDSHVQSPPNYAQAPVANLQWTTGDPRHIGHPRNNPSSAGETRVSPDVSHFNTKWLSKAAFLRKGIGFKMR